MFKEYENKNSNDDSDYNQKQSQKYGRGQYKERQNSNQFSNQQNGSSNNSYRNQQQQNNNREEFYPKNKNRQFDDEYDDDQNFKNDGPSKRNNRNNQQRRQNRKNDSNQYSSDDGSYSESGSYNKKNENYSKSKQSKKIDPNGHNPNAQIDKQYDRSKIDHYYDNKDVKFSKEKRFNIYHQKDQEQYFNNVKSKTQNDPNRNNDINQDEDYSIEDIIQQVDFDVNLNDILQEQNLENYEWDDLYSLFKLSEKKNSQYYSKKDDNKVIFDKEEMDSDLFKFFSQLAKILILQNLELASQKKIDQRLWDIYKKKIEQSKKQKLVSTNESDQLHIFDSKIQFLRGILQDVVQVINKNQKKAKYKSELSSEIKQKNKKRRIIANLFCYFGELIELKEKVSRLQKPANVNNMLFAAGQYFKAINIYPFCGKFYLVLATLSYLSEDDFSAIYWCIRALYSDQSFPCKENLQEFLEKNRQKCIKFVQEHNAYGQIDKNDYFKVFILHFLSYVNIVLTKIGIESMQVHAQMFDYLQKHIKFLQTSIQQNQDIGIKNQSTNLCYVTQMIIFTLQKIQEFIKLKDQEVLTTKILENDILASSCLKYTYGLLNYILELYINTDCQHFIDLVIPIVCYLNSNQPIADYLFSKFSQFQALFNKVLSKSQQRFRDFENQYKRSYFEDLCDTYLCDIEISMIGYTPFNPYFENNKDKYKLLSDENLQYPLKLFIILDKLPKIESFQILAKEEQATKTNQKDDEDFFFIKSTPQKENAEEQESKQVIIIDGMNVAIRYGQSQFIAKGLQITVDFWLNHQANVLIFLPDFCFSQEQIEKKRAKFLKDKIQIQKPFITLKQTDRLKTLPDDVETLIKLRDQGYAASIPNQCYDDSYMIDYARKKDAFIMTNDRYNDHIQNYKNPKQMEIVRQWIRNNCMSFAFVKDDLQPDPDFIQKRTKINIDNTFQ